MKWLYASLRLFTIFCFKFFGRLEVRGAEYVPRYGPLIVISNHLSYNDPPALFAGTPSILNYLGNGPFIFNLGHGVLPETPVPHVEKLIKFVRKG